VRIRRATLFHRTAVAPPDTTAPTLVSATVENATPSQIDLAFSEAMNATWSASNAFAVSAGHTLSGITRTGPTTGYLTTSTPFANGEAARTLAYTQPGSNNMQDLAGNLLANFSGVAITNNVSAGSGTAAPFAPTIRGPGSTTSSSITVPFDPPTTTVEGNPLTGGDAITKFEVYYSTVFDNANSAAGTHWTPDPGSSATSVTINSGLSSGTTYYVRIRAITAYGPSLDSNIRDFTTS
jgi:hypothetical protein